MPIQHRSQIETSISRLQQTAYGTARTSGADYRRIISDSQDVGDLSTAFQDDAGYDQGTDLANDLWAITNDASLNLTPDFCFQDIGYLLMDALGGYAVSQLDAGPYQHVFTPQNVNTSRQLGQRTILKKYGGLKLVLFRDMVAENLSISGGKTGRIKVSASYRGSGYYEEDPAGYSSPAIVDDREWAYNGQLAALRFSSNAAGTAQVETATAAGTVSGAGNAKATVTSANLTGSPIVVTFAVAMSDTAAAWAAKCRAALRANAVINKRFIVSGSSTSIILTDRIKAANDATLNIALDNDTSTGITPAATSADSTAGVAATYQNYSCNLETWSLQLNNPAGDDGYRQCSDYLVSGDPLSGAVRKEHLLGVRDYMFDFTARLDSGDAMRGWLKAGTELSLDIPIFGIDANDHSLVIQHNKVRVIEAKEIPDAGGYIGISGKCRLMGDSGSIGLTATLINNVTSYSS